MLLLLGEAYALEWQLNDYELKCRAVASFMHLKRLRLAVLGCLLELLCPLYRVGACKTLLCGVFGVNDDTLG